MQYPRGPAACPHEQGPASCRVGGPIGFCLPAEDPIFSGPCLLVLSREWGDHGRGLNSASLGWGMSSMSGLCWSRCLLGRSKIPVASLKLPWPLSFAAALLSVSHGCHSHSHTSPLEFLARNSGVMLSCSGKRTWGGGKGPLDESKVEGPKMAQLESGGAGTQTLACLMQNVASFCYSIFRCFISPQEG